MKSLIKYLLISAALGFVACGTPPSANADPYWRNHWGWYDNSYRPYYHQYYGPTYYPNNGAYYGGYYNGPYTNGYYGNGYTGYNSFYGPAYVAPGVGVRVGRTTFGWW